MLADDGHVTIDGVSYVLAEDEEPHYNHRFESLFSPTQAIAGEIAKEQIRPEKLLWSWTDWSGGEGGRIYYPQDSTRYDEGTLINGTIPGQLTGRSRRYRQSKARAGANADTSSRPVGASADQYAIVAWEDNILYDSTAGQGGSWTISQDASPDMSQVSYADAISDGSNIAFLESGSGAAWNNAIPVTANGTTWVDTETGTTTDPPMVGAVLDGVPYVWGDASGGTSMNLTKKSTGMINASDWATTVIFTLGLTFPGVWGSTAWSSMVAAETSLFFCLSTKSQSYVWECRNDVVRPYWTPPPGIIIKKLIYTDGILFAIGNQQAAGKKFAFIRAVPLQTRTPILVAQPRKHTNTELTEFSVGCAGPDAQIYAGDAVSGKIFVYDIRRDALHLLDDLANGGAADGMSYGANDRIAFLAMHGNRLFGATWNAVSAATSLQLFSYDDLEPANRNLTAMTANVISPEWDFGVPMELKALIGFYVTYKVENAATTSGLSTNSRITISYSIDDAAYVDMAVIDKDTQPSGARGRVFQQVSTGDTTIKFSRLKIKITLDNNSATQQPPVIFGVTAEAQLMAYAETWDLAVRVEDEDSNEGPTSRQNSGSFLRDHLESLAVNKNVVTFRDGYRYKQNATYTEHTVVVEDPADTIVTNGEGVMRIKLRAIL